MSASKSSITRGPSATCGPEAAVASGPTCVCGAGAGGGPTTVAVGAGRGGSGPGAGSSARAASDRVNVARATIVPKPRVDTHQHCPRRRAKGTDFAETGRRVNAERLEGEGRPSCAIAAPFPGEEARNGSHQHVVYVQSGIRALTRRHRKHFHAFPLAARADEAIVEPTGVGALRAARCARL